ncbi:hypothetical protein [Legionella londiniensis]|uniref:Uncharacterized protein n=1 Tax=Legionella londiniensis TaxID=45068 RepID=A0A0W0VPM1_9GAMM|nr:hypothetical protein [Legionella londiniensis]KTD21686.1 hypothetical protein Llon_0851 [Legionella londiniensis]STX93479.1 Uncharacterised protein [Legionella londiniensis]
MRQLNVNIRHETVKEKKIRHRLKSIFLGFFIFNSCHADIAATAGNLLTEASRGSIYKEPSSMELIRAEALFRSMYRGDYQGLKKKWNELNFDLIEVQGSDEHVLIVKEKDKAKFGRGFYIFRVHDGKHTLQAPHSFFDYKTRQITLELFFTGDFKAAAWNTVSRKSIDMARAEESYMMAFSKAFAHENSKRYLIQIHGFRQAKRNTKAGRHAEMILSSGEGFPSPIVQRLARCLKNKVDEKTRVCFIDIFELCATGNAIGRMLKTMGHAGFIHMELSFKRRFALLKDRGLLVKLKDCLTE